MCDPSLIPPGPYCYRVLPLRQGEVLLEDRAAFGKSLREYPYRPGYKELLCSYWQRTDHGTIKCCFLGKEVLDEDDPDAIERLAKYLGSKELAGGFPVDSVLSDEIKICGVRMDEEESQSNSGQDRSVA